jgi:hypothetical protein
MNDQELRTLVRQAIARHTGGVREMPPGPPAAILRLHPSHGVFTLPSGGEMDGPCLIEPSVPCNHCGYCKSYGH